MIHPLALGAVLATEQPCNEPVRSKPHASANTSPASRGKVVAFCDVDVNKVGTTYQYYAHTVPVIHFRDAKPPIVTCVATERTDGAFEANLASLGLEEGVDYYLFG